MYVREAATTDVLEIRRILDAAMLEPGDVETRISEGDVLVAVERRSPGAAAIDDAAGNGDATVDGNATADSGASTGERILGAIVLEPRKETDHIAALAVRKRRRDRGVGTALVDVALDRRRRVTANFDDRVRPFYESLGFAIEPIDEHRNRGVCRREE